MARNEIEKIARAITSDPNVINENLVPGGPGDMPAPGGMPSPGGGDQNADQFMVFLNAIISSAPHGKQDLVLQNMAAASPRELQAMMHEVEPVGSTRALSDYVMSKPSRIRLITQVAGKLFDEDTVWTLVDRIEMTAAEEEENEEGDYYDQGDDSDGH